MNAARNQKVVLYRGGKLDHVVQEGREPAYTKKFYASNMRRRRSNTPWYVK